jgi:hypothetical protein
MWFTSKKIPKEQIERRLFEFKGAVQTCNLGTVKFSLKVLTADLGQVAKESNFYKEIEEFDDKLTEGGSRRKVLYYSFENLLNSLKIKKEIILNDITQMPHGFSCPINRVLENNELMSFWHNVSALKFYLNDLEVESRVQKFSEFILDEDYNADSLNDIKWHKSDLTSDIVSGSEFAGDSPRLKPWEDFSDSIMSFGRLSIDQKNIAIEKFKEMLKRLPYNNFK